MKGRIDMEMRKINLSRITAVLMAVVLAVVVWCGSTVSAAEKFGGVELGGEFGGYTIVDTSAAKLPQDAATAIGAANNGVLGATYNPIWYIGHQLVNGTNHLFVAEAVRSTKDRDTSIVGLVVNVPAGEGYLSGKGAKARVIESDTLDPEVKDAFTSVTKELLGVDYKPVLYVGRQIVHGTNHYIVCEARGVYPGAKPYAAVMCINICDGNASLVSITPINASAGTKTATGMFGYAFTWLKAPH